MKMSPQVAIVTGAAGGIGAATVQRLLADGYATALVDSIDALPVLATAKHSAYLGSACRELGIAFTEDDVAGCLQRDVKAYGKAEVAA